MAKNFGKSPAAKRFDEVAKSSIINTNATVVKLIENSDLIDYPNNGEDISYTADIEKSIGELGFTDPIEVTGFSMTDGKYMILSGHRRRTAGVKCGMDLFPCIIKTFENENDVQNYVLLSNSQRDSVKDPLLYCKRYKMHEQHLKSVNFQGSIPEEIADRLGISVQQAFRYNQMNKIIPPVWDLVREDIVGMSNVLPMSTLNNKEQHDIFEILKECSDNKTELTREKVKEIIESYKNKNSDSHGESRESNNSYSHRESVKPNAIKSLKSIHSHIEKIVNIDFNDFNDKDKEEAKNILEEIEKIIKTLTVRV
jgi:ParB/RepB/Spo0J family partition protein